MKKIKSHAAVSEDLLDTLRGGEVVKMIFEGGLWKLAAIKFLSRKKILKPTRLRQCMSRFENNLFLPDESSKNWGPRQMSLKISCFVLYQVKGCKILT